MKFVIQFATTKSDSMPLNLTILLILKVETNIQIHSDKHYVLPCRELCSLSLFSDVSTAESNGVSCNNDKHTTTTVTIRKRPEEGYLLKGDTFLTLHIRVFDYWNAYSSSHLESVM